MYTPRQVGIPNDARGRVVYKEHPPTDDIADAVYCTWELQTLRPLEKDFNYLILPDVCTDIIFDLCASKMSDQCFIMASGSDAAEINLGKTFHYIGIRFLPGVLEVKRSSEMVVLAQKYNVWQTLNNTKSAETFKEFIKALRQERIVTPSYIMQQILLRSETLQKVSDVETLTGYSRRQLQRLFMHKTGFTPHDFLKILRFQNTLAEQQHHYYTDQSHYIREFKRITGMTPRIFKAKY